MRERVKQVDLLSSALDWAEAQCGSVENCPDCAGFDIAKTGKNCGLALAVDYLMANGFIAQHWIPVKERLPETGQPVIACVTHRFGDRSVVPMIFWHVTYFHWQDVTHWMPLPDPPEESTPETYTDGAP